MANIFLNERIVLIGHPFAPIGRGEDIRCFFRSFLAVNSDVRILDVFKINQQSDDLLYKEFKDFLVSEPGRINIFVINADEIDPILKHLRINLPNKSYNIIVPQWELPNFPTEWIKKLELFNEIWAPSLFVYETLKKNTSIPLYYLPLSIEVKLTSFVGRRYFNLPESSFLFLFLMDFRSYIQRKNPFAIIDAFDLLCDKLPDEDVGLVLKLNGVGISTKADEDFNLLKRRIGSSKHKEKIILIPHVLDDNETKNLIRNCDCLCSLHRSEGFGRTLAEAMYLKKVCIATSFGGNMDFMNKENSFLVNYKLIPVKEGEYPFYENQLWADPDIEEASNYMIYVTQNKEEAFKIGERASISIRKNFSYLATGVKYMNRIEEIKSFLSKN